MNMFNKTNVLVKFNSKLLILSFVFTSVALAQDQNNSSYKESELKKRIKRTLSAHPTLKPMAYGITTIGFLGTSAVIFFKYLKPKFNIKTSQPNHSQDPHRMPDLVRKPNQNLDDNEVLEYLDTMDATNMSGMLWSISKKYKNQDEASAVLRVIVLKDIERQSLQSIQAVCERNELYAKNDARLKLVLEDVEVKSAIEQKLAQANTTQISKESRTTQKAHVTFQRARPTQANIKNAKTAKEILELAAQLEENDPLHESIDIRFIEISVQGLKVAEIKKNLLSDISDKSPTERAKAYDIWKKVSVPEFQEALSDRDIRKLLGEEKKLLGIFGFN